jgi:hypothetical protein
MSNEKRLQNCDRRLPPTAKTLWFVVFNRGKSISWYFFVLRFYKGKLLRLVWIHNADKFRIILKWRCHRIIAKTPWPHQLRFQVPVHLVCSIDVPKFDSVACTTLFLVFFSRFIFVVVCLLFYLHPTFISLDLDVGLLCSSLVFFSRFL